MLKYLLFYCLSRSCVCYVPSQALAPCVEICAHTNPPCILQILCAYLAKLGPMYEADICANMLAFMANFGLDSNHLSVQVYIELLKHHTDQLSLDQMVEVSQDFFNISNAHTLISVKCFFIMVSGH